MNLTCSRHNIRFLELFFRYLNFWAVAPRFDFDKRIIKQQKLCKTFALILTGLIVFAYFAKYYLWVQDEDVFDLNFITILIVSSEFFMTLLSIIAVLGAAFWHVDKWRYLFQCFFITEKYLVFQTNEQPSLFTNLNFQFLLTNAVVLTILINAYCFNGFFTGEEGFLTKVVQIVEPIETYGKCMKVTLVYNLALAIKCKYQDLNRFVVKGCHLKKREMLQSIKKASHLYGLSGEMVGTFNRLFEWEIILSLFHSSITEMQCFAFARLYFLQILPVSKDHPLPSPVIINYVLLFLISVAGPVLVMLSCDWAAKEAGKIATTCYKYQACFPTFSEEKEELLNLANQIINDKPSFTAAGFFEVNSKTLFTLFGTITTYFIVIVQFT